jgi:uncharacterized YigZ family protein
MTYHIAAPSTAEITIKKSRFIGYLYPITSESEAMGFLTAIKHQHPKANHFCYAGIISPSWQRSNDDGEPAGTAGMPLLTLFQQTQLDLCFVIVVRYFGGILLGTGGLHRAYQQAGLLAIKNAKLTVSKTLTLYQLTFPYELVGRVEHQLATCTITDKQYTATQAIYQYLTDQDLSEQLAAVSAGRLIPQVIGTQTIEVPVKQPLVAAD